MNKPLPALFLASALVLASQGCGGSDSRGDVTGPGPATKPVVATITLSPAPVVLRDAGESFQLTLVARDASGATISDVSAQWSSSDTSVVTVSQVGLVSAVDEGTATVTATMDNVSGSASAVVEFQWSTVAPGSLHACALRGGRPYCWGVPTFGEVQDPGSDGIVLTPRAVETDLIFVALDAGERHTCGLTKDGAIYCWGQNLLGQLGNGSDLEAGVPTAAAGGLTFAAMTLGDYHTCGLTYDGVAYCWGGGGIEGNGRDLAMGHQPADICTGSSYFSSRCTRTPRRVDGGVVFAQMSAGLFHTCGVDRSGAAYCWGWNRALGNGENNSAGDPFGYDAPVAVSGGHFFTQVSAGNLHSCGVTDGGSALCWGGITLNQGQLGTGRFDMELDPASVMGLTNLTSIDATKENSIYALNTCALAGDGSAYCWGSDAEGQIGAQMAMEECTKAGTAVPCSSRPLKVEGGLTFASVQTGLEFACGVTRGGEIYCWGLNSSGQLGNGTTNSSMTPTKIKDPPGLHD